MQSESGTTLEKMQQGEFDSTSEPLASPESSENSQNVAVTNSKEGVSDEQNKTDTNVTVQSTVPESESKFRGRFSENDTQITFILNID